MTQANLSCIQAVKFNFNVQHDCRKAHCEATGSRVLQQERLDSDHIQQFIEHSSEVEEYIVNLHALHNAHLLRRALPRYLTKPTPLFDSEEARRAAHNVQAARVRETLAERTRAAKRARTEGNDDASKKSTDGARQPEVREQPGDISMQ